MRPLQLHFFPSATQVTRHPPIFHQRLDSCLFLGFSRCLGQRAAAVFLPVAAGPWLDLIRLWPWLAMHQRAVRILASNNTAPPPPLAPVGLCLSDCPPLGLLAARGLRPCCNSACPTNTSADLASDGQRRLPCVPLLAASCRALPRLSAGTHRQPTPRVPYRKTPDPVLTRHLPHYRAP